MFDNHASDCRLHKAQQECRDHAIVERLQLTVDHCHIRIVSLGNGELKGRDAALITPHTSWVLFTSPLAYGIRSE